MTAEDGSYWELSWKGGVERLYVNPRHYLPSWAWAMVNLWRAYQGGGMGGGGHLPEDMMEQPAIMIDAFNLMSNAEAELKPEG